MDQDELLDNMLRTLRGTLHACAEPAGAEALTASVISNFLTAYSPDLLLTEIGGHGVAAVYEGRWQGPTVLVRGELDALPVEETRAAGETAYANTEHRCGHDGHMAMVAGLAPLLHRERPVRGRVVLLFQPAEETGEGALRVLADAQFPSIRPDYALALHNLPGFPRNTVVVRRGTFASASVGMRVRLRGQAAHAAEPEQAHSPAAALARLLETLPKLNNLDDAPYRLLTMTHARMGRKSFGITPGRATICATLRSASTEGLERLCGEAEEIVREAAAAEGLRVKLSWHERFPETRNDDDLVRMLEHACHEEGIPVVDKEVPFRWSEDFGYFAQVCPTLYFGLGTGENSPGLHQPDYDFPDQVMDVGVRTFSKMVRTLTHPVREVRESAQ